MDREQVIALYNRVYPGFFELESIRSMPAGEVFDELILPLRQFDPSVYDKPLPDSVSFGFYQGGTDALHALVSRVEPEWVRYFNDTDRVYCGYVDARPVSFCLVDDYGALPYDGRALRIGGPGGVGTDPGFRNRGIGLSMVRNVTSILKSRGFDYSYIHFTQVTAWYGKLGYKVVLRWNRDGFV